MNKKIMLIFCLLAFLSSCDKEKNKLRDGNDFYQEKDYAKAEEQYRKSLVADSNYLKAQYNLANASYKQQNQEKIIDLVTNGIEGLIENSKYRHRAERSVEVIGNRAYESLKDLHQMIGYAIE